MYGMDIVGRRKEIVLSHTQSGDILLLQRFKKEVLLISYGILYFAYSKWVELISEEGIFLVFFHLFIIKNNTIKNVRF